MITIKELSGRMIEEIKEDARVGLIPVDVETFGDLDNYRDSNCYGGLCEDEVYDAIVLQFGGNPEDHMPEKAVEFIEAARDIAHAWIEGEGIPEYIGALEETPREQQLLDNANYWMRRYIEERRERAKLHDVLSTVRYAVHSVR